ncbi:DinB family protein [Sporosarcina sp. FSL K6-1508]|uniref:DinB family protein n=1 Tax=Sporosarcina sp. FSL K6-1508 TaxID=2921553 RepID=UPI0030F4C51E
MEENKKIREAVLRSVENLSDEQLNEQVEEGRWSIMQVLNHLYLMERAIVHTLSNQLANGENKTTVDKPIQFTTDRSTKVLAPSFATPSDDFIALTNMKSNLTTSRENLNTLVASADKTLLAQRTYPHPVFGDLSLEQWIPFIGLHEKRHLAQIEEVKEKLV